MLSNDLYDGQTIDARRYSDAWLEPGFSDEAWTGVHPAELDFSHADPRTSVRLLAGRRSFRPHQDLDVPGRQDPRRLRADPGGVDASAVQGPLGRPSLSGTPRCWSTATRAPGPAERQGDGPLHPQRRRGRVRADVHLPRLSLRRGRGLAGRDLRQARVPCCHVVYSDLARIGQFKCSDELLNQLHGNVVWGTRGNFLDVPTDCPQRDERLGWTGDIAVFAPTAAYLFDVIGFLRDWLRTSPPSRAAGGTVSLVVPDVFKYIETPSYFRSRGTAIWSDAAVWVPWALWRAYGDLGAERTVDSMIAHVRRVESLLSPTGVWDTGFQFGDWLDPTRHRTSRSAAKADNGVVATACLYRHRPHAHRDGRPLEAAGCRALQSSPSARELRSTSTTSRRRHHPSDAHTVYALAIVFGLLDDEERGWREAAGGAGGRERQPHPDRLRRHAVHHWMR